MARAETWADPKVEDWLRRQPKDLRDLCEAARGVLDLALPDARQAIKWGFPTWVGKGTIVAIVPYTSHVNLQFHRGASLPDPDGLLLGSGKELRHVRLEHAKDLKTPTVKALLRAAWRLDQEGA